MGNSLSAVTPKILARGLMALRENAVMPRLVNTDYSNDAMRKGDAVNVPVPNSLGVAQDVTAAVSWSAGTDITPTSVAITL